MNYRRDDINVNIPELPGVNITRIGSVAVLAFLALTGCAPKEQAPGRVISQETLAENQLDASTAYTVSNSAEETKVDETNAEEEKVEEQSVFVQTVSKLEEKDLRRIASEDAMNLVKTFNNATHSESFRLKEDGNVYLDLSYDEALVLTTVANYSSPDDLYKIYGDYGITSEQASNLLESARGKLLVYYMNATEPSGIKEIFHSKDDSKFFGKFEEDILTFNKEHTTDASDQVIRDTYYYFDLADAPILKSVGPLAKLLSYDMVYSTFGTTEINEENAQFFTFHKGNVEDETRYLTDQVYPLYIDMMNSTQKALYESKTISDGARLRNFEEQNYAIFDSIGLQNSSDLKDSCDGLVFDAFNGLERKQESVAEERSKAIVTANLDLAKNLYAANELEDASFVLDHLTEQLSKDFVDKISKKGGFEGLNDQYLKSIGSVDNRVGMDEVISSANQDLSTITNYSSNISEENLSTLRDNRLNNNKLILSPASSKTELDNEVEESAEAEETKVDVEEQTIEDIQETTSEEVKADDEDKKEEKETTKETETKNETSKEDKTDGEDQDKEKKTTKKGEGSSDKGEAKREEQNQTSDEKKTSPEDDKKTEKAKEDDSKKENKNHEENKSLAKKAEEDAKVNGKEDANSYANSNEYRFEQESVVNPTNGTVYNLNDVSFVNGYVFGYAYSESEITIDESQINNARDKAASEYVNSLDNEYIEKVADGWGVSEEEAKEKIKKIYKSSYDSQIKDEIAAATETGEYLKDSAERFISDVKSQEYESSIGTNESVDNSSTFEEGEKDTTNEGNPTQDSTKIEIYEGEKEVPYEPIYDATEDYSEEPVQDVIEPEIYESEVDDYSGVYEGEVEVEANYSTQSESQESGGMVKSLGTQA